MFVALFVALLAVVLGLLLGLAPAAGRRAFGPLRTLAFTAVLAVVGLHLLPEALAALGALGLLVFAAALALPRWLTWLPKRAEHEGYVGLELGYWALVVHHIGDGLALGAYGRVDGGGNRHVDVLLALVLHTVPLVAVVAAGYAQTSGLRAAIVRSAGLALASALGVLLTGLVPESIASGAQAWVAAGVSGLLLHGLTHDLGRDLPSDGVGRALDFAMAVLGGALGWLGMHLEESHADPHASPVLMYLESGLERVALPFLLGIVFSALPELWRKEPAPDEGVRPRPQAAVSAEGFLVTMAHFGWFFAVARDVLGAVGSVFLRGPAAAEPADSALPVVPRWQRVARRLGERFDALAAWCLAGVLISAVIQASLAWGALDAKRPAAFAVALLLSLSVPLHAVAATQIAAALFTRGFPASSAFLIAVLSPLGARRPNASVLAIAALVVVAAFLFADDLPRAPLWIASSVAKGAAIVLLAFTALRAQKLGLRGLLLALRRPLYEENRETLAKVSPDAAPHHG